jgi:ABC-type amino acid transport system permease subunit
VHKNIQVGISWGLTFSLFTMQNFWFYFVMAVIGLGLNEAGYMAEIIRAGISSVPEGRGRSIHRAGHVVVDDDAAHNLFASHARNHPAYRE